MLAALQAEGSGFELGVGRAVQAPEGKERGMLLWVQACEWTAQAHAGLGIKAPWGALPRLAPPARLASPCTDRYFLWQCLSWLRRSCTSHT